MSIRHHLTDELLMAYAAGILPEAFNLVVATHVSLCDECRARLGAYEALGGAVLEDVPGAAVSVGSLAATMALIRDRGKDPIVAPPQAPRPASGLFPAPLRSYVGGDVEVVKWRPMGGGVRQAILPSSKDATVRLLYIPAGAAVPDHGHRGTELTQVLQGAFRDDADRFGPGDIEVASEETQHRPVAEAGADCICLAATDAPLRFSTMLPRIVQPFFRI